jgi:hypothetical protein
MLAEPTLVEGFASTADAWAAAQYRITLMPR